jgi:hypothetical protein
MPCRAIKIPRSRLNDAANPPSNPPKRITSSLTAPTSHQDPRSQRSSHEDDTKHHASPDPPHWRSRARVQGLVTVLFVRPSRWAIRNEQLAPDGCHQERDHHDALRCPRRWSLGLARRTRRLSDGSAGIPTARMSGRFQAVKSCSPVQIGGRRSLNVAALTAADMVSYRMGVRMLLW